MLLLVRIPDGFLKRQCIARLSSVDLDSTLNSCCEKKNIEGFT
jgi:hypothetical protein